MNEIISLKKFKINKYNKKIIKVKEIIKKENLKVKQIIKKNDKNKKIYISKKIIKK